MAKASCSVLPEGRKLEEPHNSPDNKKGAILISFDLLFPADPTLAAPARTAALELPSQAKPSQAKGKK